MTTDYTTAPLDHGRVLVTTSFSMPFGFPALDGLPFQERKRLGVAIGRFQAPSQPLENFYGRTLYIAGMIQHPAELTDKESGELKPCVRTVFLLDTGDCISSPSDAVNRFAQQLVAICGTPELGLWEEVIPIKVLPQKTQAGRTTFALSMVEE